MTQYIVDDPFGQTTLALGNLSVRRPRYEALDNQWFPKQKFLLLFKHGFPHKTLARGI